MDDINNTVEAPKPKPKHSTEHLKKYQFSATNRPKNRGGRKPGLSPTELLNQLSRTNIRFHNPITNKDEVGPASLVVALQLLLKATQDSDLPSIREYFDRIDGKVEAREDKPKVDVHITLITPSGRLNDNRVTRLSI